MSTRSCTFKTAVTIEIIPPKRGDVSELHGRVFLEIIILWGKMLLQISYFCKMDDCYRNPLNYIEENRSGKMEGGVIPFHYKFT
jgi:hypothetical protein